MRLRKRVKAGGESAAKGRWSYRERLLNCCTHSDICIFTPFPLLMVERCWIIIYYPCLRRCKDGEMFDVLVFTFNQSYDLSQRTTTMSSLARAKHGEENSHYYTSRDNLDITLKMTNILKTSSLQCRIEASNSYALQKRQY